MIVQVFTFDCTLQDIHKQVTLPPGIQLHEWCIGEDNEARKYYSLRTVMNKLNHQVIHLLKMDIESSEWQVFPLLYATDQKNLPLQISVEIHIETGGDWFTRILQHILDMHSIGYLLLSKEINTRALNCCELTWVKMEYLRNAYTIPYDSLSSTNHSS